MSQCKVCGKQVGCGCNLVDGKCKSCREKTSRIIKKVNKNNSTNSTNNNA